MLEIRARELEAIQQRFAVQQSRVIEIETMISEAQAQIQAMLLPSPDDHTLQPEVSQQRFRYVQYLKMQLDSFRESLAKQQTILETLRLSLREAHVRKKSLERLKEKQEAQYYKNMESILEKELEDLMIARYNKP